MCGLSGEIRFDGRRPDLAAVGRMSERLAARGPDGQGLWTRGAVALGHRRLKIIDLSDLGAQPMTDAPGELTGVFNGCVYNYQELRDELRGLGHRFTSTSDTEVVLKAYRQWGTACVEHFHGMFAFALVEHRTGRVVLARDRLGIKPSTCPGRPVGCASPRRCPPSSPPGTWTPRSTRRPSTSTSAGTPRWRRPAPS